MRRPLSGWSRRTLIMNGVIVVALLLTLTSIAFTITRDDTSAASSTQTSTVDRGAVTASVAASGNVASTKSVDVSFTGSGGIVKKIYVKEGQHVRRGQRLAQVDQTSARQGLDSALAGLKSAEGSFTTATQERSSAEKAQDAQSIDVSAASVHSAQVALRGARSTLALDRRQHDADVARANSALTSALANQERAQQQYDSQPTAENRTAVQEAETAVSTARTTLVTARSSRESALLSDRQNVANQAASVHSARVQLQSAKATVAVSQQDPRAGAVESAQAQVDTARVSVAEARDTLDKTVLRAPTAGTVTTLNGVVGESSSSSSSASSSSSSSSSSDTSTASDSTSSSSSGFLTMTAVHLLEVTANVAEADISDVQVGQQVAVTLSASDRELSGEVTQVSPVETITNNVVEYPVTVRLNETSQVKLGQTSQVVITTGSKDDVLRVSSSALTTIGGRTTATVQGSGGATRIVSVTTGLEGDSQTEVLSGLAQGDVVVLPQQGGSGGTFTFPTGGLGGGLR